MLATSVNDLFSYFNNKCLDCFIRKFYAFHCSKNAVEQWKQQWKLGCFKSIRMGIGSLTWLEYQLLHHFRSVVGGLWNLGCKFERHGAMGILQRQQGNVKTFTSHCNFSDLFSFRTLETSFLSVQYLWSTLSKS